MLLQHLYLDTGRGVGNKIPWNKNVKGKFKHTEETKKKISTKNKGHFVSNQTKQKISKTHKNKPKTNAHKKS